MLINNTELTLDDLNLSDFPFELNLMWFYKISINPTVFFFRLTPIPQGFSIPGGFTVLPQSPRISMRDFFTLVPLSLGNSISINKKT